VDLTSSAPTPPYSNWVTAATRIQDAVNVAKAGDRILVTNGVYREGGAVVTGILTNRVAVTLPITLLSVNGPGVTMIEGSQVPVDIVGPTAVRCVYLTNGASLVGFTLTNGASADISGDAVREQCGAGVWAEGSSAIVSNCWITGNLAHSYGGGAFGAALVNCSLFDNASDVTAGGAYQCTLLGCTLTNNSGGGAKDCMLTNCTLTWNNGGNGGAAIGSTLETCLVISNSAFKGGGGVSSSTCHNSIIAGNVVEYGGGGGESSALYGCILSNNTAMYGGGAWKSVLDRCIVANNNAWDAAGAGNSTLRDCTICDNTASFNGGGAEGSVLNNCTITGNTAGVQGAGVNVSFLTNCTVSSNSVTAQPDDGWGGGAAVCTLQNCEVVGNSAPIGGGSSESTLYNCTLVANSASKVGGGALDCFSANCIIYYNNAPVGGNYYYVSNIDYAVGMEFCSTAPEPSGGGHNFTNAPLLINFALGDFRLSASSPCINSGYNAYTSGAVDVAGNPRIVGATVDIGAYEFQSPVSLISYAWLQRYNLPINPSTDAADPDGDGVNNYDEWLAGTNPTNAFSSPAQLTIIPSGTNVIITWPANALSFTLQSTTNIVSAAVWSTSSPAPVVIGGQNVVTNRITGPQKFYRLIQ
jgi:hypothetical protein